MNDPQHDGGHGATQEKDWVKLVGYCGHASHVVRRCMGLDVPQFDTRVCCPRSPPPCESSPLAEQRLVLFAQLLEQCPTSPFVNRRPCQSNSGCCSRFLGFWWGEGVRGVCFLFNS